MGLGGEYSEDVLVLGSKPQCNVPNLGFAACFTANAALMRAQELNENCSLTAVMSRDCAMDYREVIRRNIQKMKLCRADRFALVGAHLIQPLSQSLSEIVGEKEVVKYTAARRTWWVINCIGWRDAWRLVKKRGVPLDIVFRVLWKHELIAIKPSTGLCAVLLALHERPNAKVHVAGIGLDQDGVFTDSGSQGRGHVDVDRALVEQIQRTGRAVFYDL